MPSSNRIRPQVFVGSSAESRRLAYVIQQNLDDDAEVTVWDQNVFRLTKSTLDDLFERLRVSDFAIFVFAPNDVLKLRNEQLKTVRDNVLFELGLFMGHLGRDRTYIVAPKGEKTLRIPTDLLGITIGRFHSERQDCNMRAAVGPFCEQVREEIVKLGPLPGRTVKISKKPAAPKRTVKVRKRAKKPKGNLVIIEALYGLRDHRVNVAHKLNSLIQNDKLHVYVGNQLAGTDPCPNVKKDLRVKYRFKGDERALTVTEGDDLTLPQPDR